MPLTRDSNFLCAQVAKVGGISKVLVAENAAYEGLLAERLTPLLLAAQAQFKFSHILAGSSAFSRSVLPRYRYQLQYCGGRKIGEDSREKSANPHSSKSAEYFSSNKSVFVQPPSCSLLSPGIRRATVPYIHEVRCVPYRVRYCIPVVL
jgi:hypothetical protein